MKHVNKVLRIVYAALREIFDEAAYTRFLQRAESASSPAAYARFCRERELSCQRKHRCC
jgi:predicted transglutaminase-like cysteine proteinase